MRSTLAGVAETGLNVPPLCKGRGTAKWWKGFASMRSMLAGVAETGCKKQSLTAFGGAPFTQGSLLTNCASFRFSLFDFLSEQRFGLTDEVYFYKRNFNYRGISNKRLICGIFVVYL